MVTGQIVKAGKVNVNGEILTGFFIQCNEENLKKLYKENLFNEKVFVAKDKRKNRVTGPAFIRLPPTPPPPPRTL